jgi:hypothetical protein
VRRGVGEVSTKGRKVRRIFQVMILAASGWFGEWSWLVSAIYSVTDWAYTDSFSAFPRLAIEPVFNPFDRTFWYGLAWRIHYYRPVGPASLDQLFSLSSDLSGLGLFLLIGLAWALYEIFVKPYRPK